MFGLVIRLDEQDFQRGNDEHGVGQRGHQREEYRPGEKLHEFAQRSCDDARHREKHGGDSQGGNRDWHEQLLGTAHSGIKRFVALAQFVDIAVDVDDGVVHNHAEHDDEGGECHSIQFNAKEIHHPDAEGGADRQTRTGDKCRAEGEKQ